MHTGGSGSPLSTGPGASVSTHCLDCTRSLLRCDVSDPLEHIIVGSPDPTSDLYRDKGYRKCGFEWFDDTCLTLVLRWQCTRESGHPGQHLAGTGHRVAAVHRPDKLEATAKNTDSPPVIHE
jgi:hypothetical protein